MCKKILTISVAAYNVEDCLAYCLDSFVQSNVFNDLEIIIVDDGSKDSTADIARQYAYKYPESIKLIVKENGGHGSTINTSIKNASGKYFKVVDADDWVEKNGIEKLVKYLKNSEVDLVINPYYIVDANNRNKKEIAIPFQKEKVFIGKENIFEEYCESIELAMHAMTIKTGVMKKVGPIIDEKCFYVDTEYTIFPIKYIDTVICFDYSIYDYLLGTVTQSMNIKNMQKRRDQHLHVTKRLVNYYNNQNSMISDEKRKIIKRRISSVIIMQYVIYLSMKPIEGRNEIMEFDEWLKNKSEELYKYSLELGEMRKYGYMRLIGIYRRINFKLYKSSLLFLQKLNIVK